MKKWRNISMFMSVVILIVSVCLPINADGAFQQASDAVIDAELRDILLDSTATEQIPVDVWLYDPVSSVELETAISSRIGVTREQLTTNKTRTATSKEVDAYIETERALYAEKMNQYYGELLKDYSNVKALCETREGKRLFFSQYAPMISAELTPKEIKQLATDSRVESIYYSPHVEMADESDVSFPTIGVDYTRDTLGYTGSGIKIGMIEPGLPRVNDSYLKYSDIECETIADAEYTDHASAVAAIMVAKKTNGNGATYEGIVPDAKLYATYYESGNDSDWRARVEWLLSKNVHVINMSAGISTLPSGTYGILERWLDHVAINHSIHFVKSAGNNGGFITSPGMAYNVLTVGSVNDNNTTVYTDDAKMDYSSWRELIGTNESEGTNKPDLMAPGEYIATDVKITEDINHIGEDYDARGTSFAAPHVTAVVAQLCQRQPELKLLQDAMKAILTASVSHSKIRYNTMYTTGTSADITADYNKCGAGVVNARSAFSTVVESRYESGSFAANSGDGTQVMYTFNVTNTEKIVRVSLSWLKNSVFSDDDGHETDTPETASLANLNLYVYDSAGEIVRSNNNKGLNTEIVEFRPTRTGTHRIYIRQSSDSDKRVYYGVAWWHPMSS